jgi:hypothetical protein
MFWFKRCPRCTGDLYVDWDWHGRFITCVQCGLSKDVTERDGGLLEMPAGPAPAPVVPRTEVGLQRRLSHGGRHSERSFAFPGGPRAESDA